MPSSIKLLTIMKCINVFTGLSSELGGLEALEVGTMAPVHLFMHQSFKAP